MPGDTEILKNKTAAFRLVYVQTAALLALAPALYWLGEGVLLWSVLAGGAVYIVPHCCFIYCTFKRADRRDIKAMVAWFYFGEAVKFLLTLLLFAACFALLKPVNAPALFLSYIFMLVSGPVGAVLAGKISGTAGSILSGKFRGLA